MKVAGWYPKIGLLVWLALPGAMRADTFMLKDGRCIEGTAQEDGEMLVITTYTGEVLRVPRKNVMGSTSEPARNAFHAKLKALPAGDAQACFLLGTWAVEQKLPAEAKTAFERALTIDPAHEGARKALGRSTPPAGGAGSPASNDQLIIAPAVQRSEKVELGDLRALAKRLSELKENDAAGKQALAALAKEHAELFARLIKTPARSGETQMHLRAIQFMGQAGNRNSMDALLGACFEEPDEAVRRAAARALAALEEPIALRKLVDVAITPKFSWPTRQRACEALRRYGNNEAVERLLSNLSFELAGGNARDPKNPPVRSPTGLGSEDPFNVGHGNLPTGPVDERTLYPVLHALQEVTGVTFEQTGENARNEKDFRTWQQWWRENQATFRFPE